VKKQTRSYRHHFALDRRLARDFERYARTVAAFIRLAMQGPLEIAHVGSG
jgi:hypothetical protein